MVESCKFYKVTIIISIVIVLIIISYVWFSTKDKSHVWEFGAGEYEIIRLGKDATLIPIPVPNIKMVNGPS